MRQYTSHIAIDDDTKAPDEKFVMRDALRPIKVPAAFEVYETRLPRLLCVDMPEYKNRRPYDATLAHRAYDTVRSIKKAL